LRHGDLQSHLVRHPRDDGRSEGKLDQLVRDVGREAGSVPDGPRLTPRQRGVGSRFCGGLARRKIGGTTHPCTSDRPACHARTTREIVGFRGTLRLPGASAPWIVTRRACAVVARRRKESSNELSLLA
jgi:hypothetical protein